MCVCVVHLHCQNILHTTYMHGTLCCGSPDHGMSNLQSNRNAIHIHHTCTYFPRVPGYETITEQLGQMFPDTKNTCTDPSGPLCDGLHQMSPFHETCSA